MGIMVELSINMCMEHHFYIFEGKEKERVGRGKDVQEILHQVEDHPFASTEWSRVLRGGRAKKSRDDEVSVPDSTFQL